ncbi:MAG: type II secretion system F family protein [Burkholderiaceae bacterium]
MNAASDITRMRDFVIHLIDPEHGASRRNVRAADAQSAVAGSGVEPSRVLSVEPAAASSADAPRQPGRRRFPLRLFSQELAVLLGAGIPLLEGLVTLREKEASPAVAHALDAVIAALQAGEPLSAALRVQPAAFDPLFVAVVQSSERTGQIEEALREHAAYLAWVDALRGKLVSASIYPLTLIVAGVAVIVFLLLFVVPRFAGILEGVGGDLPATSRALIAVGAVSGENPWSTAAVALALLIAPVLAWRHGTARRWVIEQVWRMPLLGPKLHLLALAQFYRTSSMLLGAGVPAIAALRTAREVISIRLRAPLDDAIERVGRGERMSVALQAAGLTTPVSLRMIRVGERSGNLGPMLRNAAEFYDEELSRLTELVTRLVNPALMLVMGVVIGSIVVLMYLPIFQLVEQVQ